MLETISKIKVAEALVEAGTESRSAAGLHGEQLVGDTPLVQLRRVMAGAAPGVQVLAKAEWYNPGSSIKDRAALNIIRTAEASGEITPDRR